MGGGADAMQEHLVPARSPSSLSIEGLTREVEDAAERVRTGRCSGQEAFAYPMVVSVVASWSQLFSKAFGMELRNGVSQSQIMEFVITIVLLVLLSISSLA